MDPRKRRVQIKLQSIKGTMTTGHANKANSENRLLSQVPEREILAAELSLFPTPAANFAIERPCEGIRIGCPPTLQRSRAPFRSSKYFQSCLPMMHERKV